MAQPLVGIVMGSSSDSGIMEEAAHFLESVDIPCEMSILSAHRTPQRTFQYASSARDRGLKVIIAGAGGAAHLPGVIAALTTLPVIGVPIKSGNSVEGLDSILSILQMPPGIPVATVGLNGARNAGILAAEILGASDPRIEAQLQKARIEMQQKVEQSARELEESRRKRSALEP